MGWISRKELRTYLIIVAGVTVIALIITLVSLLPGYIQYNKNVKLKANSIGKPIDMSLFMIPDSYSKFRENTFIPFLPEKANWTSSDIGPYWQEPKKLVLDYLKKQNEKYINEIFKDIP